MLMVCLSVEMLICLFGLFEHCDEIFLMDDDDNVVVVVCCIRKCAKREGI